MAASARLWLALFVLAAVTAAGAIAREAAQLPVESMSLEVNDARVEDMSDSGLDDAIAAAEGTPTEPLWVAYAIDGVERNGSLCCGRAATSSRPTTG